MLRSALLLWAVAVGAAVQAERARSRAERESNPIFTNPLLRARGRDEEQMQSPMKLLKQARTEPKLAELPEPRSLEGKAASADPNGQGARLPLRGLAQRLRKELGLSATLGVAAWRILAHRRARALGATLPARSEAYEVEKVRPPDHDLPVRHFLRAGGRRVSPWHDVPLEAGGGALHMVVEIPQGTRAKNECMLDVPSNPIAQEVKNGKPRMYHEAIHWNYGFLPQTWEDPDAALLAGLPGDGDPVDCVELGAGPLAPGTVLRVRVLGALPMVDDGELDWKVLVWREGDAAAPADLEDLERRYPGTVSAVREWFRTYKQKDGITNSFVHEGVTSAADTRTMLAEAHRAWSNVDRVDSVQQPDAGVECKGGACEMPTEAPTSGEDTAAAGAVPAPAASGVTIYGATWCNFCKKAKDLAERTATPHTYYNLDADLGVEPQAARKALQRHGVPEGFKTVPMIFVDGEFIGGYTELLAKLG